MTADLLVVGAGVVGLAAARAWAIAHPSDRVVVIDKESALGAHASGRNSGVLHAGFYYASDSLKARYCRDGNARWKAFLADRGVPVNPCGKLVVARDAVEIERLDALAARGVANGVELKVVDAHEAAAIEPRARVFERALWSPTTASVDPVRALEALAADARDRGVEVRLGARFVARDGDGAVTSVGQMSYGRMINAAGLYADVVARAYGAAVDRRIVPFKGLYLYGDEREGSLRTCVYPAPDPAFPFLGVHLTVTVDGHAKIGPTALPALWRENYGGLAGFSAAEAWDVALRDLRLLADPGFRRLAVREVLAARRSALVGGADKLVSGLAVADWTRWGRPGIRAQLVGPDGKLDMDFRIETTAREVHVLNAVSPAFTCALAFADAIVERVPA